MINNFVLIVVFTILAGFTTSCINLKTEPYKKYKLASGKIIECKRIELEHCGQRFLNCSDGNIYRCQTNVEPQ